MAPFDPILPTFSGLNLNHQNDHQHCPSLRNTKPSKKPPLASYGMAGTLNLHNLRNLHHFHIHTLAGQKH